MKYRVFAAGLAALLSASLLPAHDFWIEPSTFRPAAGEEFTVSLRVGEHYQGEPVPRDDRRILKFFLVSALGESPIPGLPGSDPAGFARADAPGLIVVGYRSGRSPVSLEADEFEKYLADEGLDAVLAARARRGEKGKPGREVFSRSVKSIVIAPGGKGPEFDRRLGLTLELVLETSPAAWRADRPMRFRLLYEGKPLGAALVKAISRSQPDKTLTARTARNGTASMALPGKGVWLVEAVHMIPAPKDADADWESIWSSVTFEIP
ncbi:MAG: DUF4198 domain-containing protein [Acidobacteriota bacterium]